MKRILEFSKFQAEYRPITLHVKGIGSIHLDEKKVEQKEILIRSIINKIYPGFRKDESFERNGVMISGELLNKTQKNIAILYEMIDIAKSIGIQIKTADDLINFISQRGQDLFSSDGQFFKRIYKRLGGATELGKEKESVANDFFKRFAKERGIDIELKSPKSYKDDIGGIDAYFEYNGKTWTIQTKTLSKVEETEKYLNIYITGDFTKVKTNYFIVISKDGLGKNYIFKGRNVINLRDEEGADYYQVPKSDLIYTEF